MTQKWLKEHFLKPTNLLQGNPSEKDFFIKSEFSTVQAFNAIAEIIHDTSESSFWSEPNHIKTVDILHDKLCEVLNNELISTTNRRESGPAFEEILNSLYTTYELGRTVSNFTMYFSRTHKSVKTSQTPGLKKVKAASDKLMKEVIERASEVKKSLDEGGWIDKVLECVMGDGLDEEVEVGQDGEFDGITAALKTLVDEYFIEEWAGQVVQSWKDSVEGFSYFKLPKV
jgi:N-terminal acetyltransferase B complex non-catalytic subunit